MVDLDQCAHATINGCDKEQRGWYPLPSAPLSVYLPPLMPITLLPPLPNCFSPTIAPVPHLRWHPPRVNGGWGEAGGGVTRHPPDDFSEGRPQPPPWPALVPRENSESLALSDLSSDSSAFHHLLTYSPQLFHPRSLSHLSLACNSTCPHPGVEFFFPPFLSPRLECVSSLVCGSRHPMMQSSRSLCR